MREKNMRDIEFHNREKEIKAIRNILDTKPTLISFIYGPINSGKTELINHLIKQLPEEYVSFYINLRTKLLASYDEFVESLFEMELEETSRKETLKELVSSVTKAAGIPITSEFLDFVFRDKKPKNAFTYIIKLFEAVKSMGKQPVLILDELQKIGDVKVNGLLIYELFNFFIDLTKEKHLAQVFVVTSDSLFIERVYSEAMLHGRCRYLLVDDFNEETTTDFLGKYEFSDKQKELAWEYCGGKPACLVELINAEEREEKVKEWVNIRTGQIEGLIEDAGEFGFKVYYGEEEIVLNEEHILKSLDRFRNKDHIKAHELTKSVKLGLIKANILFLDPVKQILKPQSRLDLLAIRAVIKNGA
jgi:AAA+ ATPase superfamily predicted ATPase